MHTCQGYLFEKYTLAMLQDSDVNLYSSALPYSLFLPFTELQVEQKMANELVPLR